MTPDPYQFERDVADLYRSLGAEVRHDVSVAGTQIDVVVVERTPSGSPITRVVECKAYETVVGVEQVRIFALTSRLLRDEHRADVATIVSMNGFSRPAREAAEEFGVELLEYADLQARVSSAQHSTPPESPVAQDRPAIESDPNVVDRRDERLRAFVALPFTPRYDDVHLYGIRAAADEVGIAVERADDNLDSSEIVHYIKTRIGGCDLIIADTTEANANVYYELGFADGLAKRVLLIAAANTELPFDLRGRNHVLYENIADLHAKLVDRLRGLLGDA
jgi:hypothetical protein